MTPIVTLIHPLLPSDLDSLAAHGVQQLQLFSDWWYSIDKQPPVGPFPTATDAAKAGVTAACAEEKRREAEAAAICAQKDGDA